MKNKGWIKLHRQLLDSAIWNVDSPYSERDAWIEFLLLANHAPKQIITRRCECIEIQRSQFFTSIRNLADRFKWSEKRVRRYLGTLTTAHMVRVERHTDGTLITIENYSNFQGEGHSDDTLKGHTDDHADDHNEVTRTRMINNTNNFNNERGRSPRSYSPPTFEEVKTYCKENNYRIDIPVFMSYYAARDWELSRGKKMTNWKSAVDAWYFRSSANRREEERHGVGLASTGLSEEEQKQALIRSEQISEIKQEPDGPGHGSKFKGGAAAELRRRQRKHEV